ncbi:FecR family protein [Oceanibacterium hippocampi]|uniref:FecR protein n=1 Tax=Oceanibacterium hippocampi TaxID=745714 RepID=A0A1Y5RA42_9PROT|nr:FecR domain-containing protein [Oceanibacterium hippocampi]SLN12565.1 FecR protein [Oceanibacterium hippocampi]
MRMTALPLVALLLLSSATGALAAGEDGSIGVSTAVQPDAQGTPPSKAPRLLETGTRMVQEERVETGGLGRTQLLFNDGSSLTIGPNSDLLLDRYVYDPEAKTGDLALSATKGLFRFVGGRISKANPVTLNVGSATIGIRGGVGIIEAGATVRAAFLYGREMIVRVGNSIQRITRPGFYVEIVDGQISAIRRLPPERLADWQGGLEASPSLLENVRLLVVDPELVNAIAAFNSAIGPNGVNPNQDNDSGPTETLVLDDESEVDNAAQNTAFEPISSPDDDFIFDPNLAVAYNGLLQEISDLAVEVGVPTDLGNFGGVATYAGAVEGYVIDGQSFRQTSGSTFNLTYNFGTNLGALDIADFDGMNFSFDVAGDDLTKTSFTSTALISSPPMTGEASGVFLNQFIETTQELIPTGSFEISRGQDYFGVGAFLGNGEINQP